MICVMPGFTKRDEKVFIFQTNKYSVKKLNKQIKKLNTQRKKLSYYISQAIVCSKRSLHLTSTEFMHVETELFGFEEVVNISCKHGYTGEAKQSKCVNLNKWNGNRPVCRGMVENMNRIFETDCSQDCRHL